MKRTEELVLLAIPEEGVRMTARADSDSVVEPVVA